MAFRPFGSAIGLAFTMSLVSPLLTNASQMQTTFRSDSARTGVFAAPPGYAFGGFAWRFQTHGSVRSTPAVFGRTLYVGSGDGALYALDATDGRLLWRYDAGSSVTSSPAVAGGAVYFQTRAGAVIALDALRGRLLWRTADHTDAPLVWGHESGDLYSSSPVVAGNALVVGSGDGAVYALGTANGRVLWRTQTGGRVRSSPAIDGNNVYAASFDGKLYALDLRTGAVRWTFATEGTGLDSSYFGYDRRSIQSSPAVRNGTIYVGARDGFLYAIDARSGRLRWRYDHKLSWVNASPAVDGGVVFAGSSDARFVQAVEATTGKELWRTPNRALGLVWSSPAVAGNIVFDADWDGRVFAIDRASGSISWIERLGGTRIFSSPVVVGDRLYYGSDDGAVYAVNLVSGPGLARAVFFDSSYSKATTVGGAPDVAAYFAHRGYTTLDSSSLQTFLTDRLRDRIPSVIVFAQDVLPDASRDAFRRYLAIDGKAIWLGTPPFILPIDIKTGNASIATIDRGRAGRFLGVSFEHSNFDLAASSATPEGRRWGLNADGYSAWPADPQSVTKVLALDEDGLAAAWVKNYGGPPGSGFVRLPISQLAGGAPGNLVNIQFAAEYEP